MKYFLWRSNSGDAYGLRDGTLEPFAGEIRAGRSVKAPVFHIPLKRDNMVGHALLETTLLWLMHEKLSDAMHRRFPDHPFRLYPVILDGKKGASFEGYDVFQNCLVLKGAVDTKASYPMGQDFEGKPCLWSPERIVLKQEIQDARPLIFSDPILPPTVVSEEFVNLLKEFYPVKRRNNVRFPPIEDPSKFGYPY